MIVAALFVPLRRIERWLHQHLFKVGWLATKNLRTTTILYYTFFLPGVALNQFFYWLIAGVFNVRAERAITWPAEQAIGELRLDFIRLARGTGKVRIAFISLAPLVAGLAAIWLISNHVLNVQPVLAVITAGQWDALPAAIGRLASTPDFYIWVYVVFTISNTMMPSFADLRPLRIVGIVLVVVAAVSLLFHVADEAILRALSGPVNDGLRVLAGTFAIMIAFDLLAVAVLGTVEAIIERVTGDSATFQNGKMITMTREELRRLREQEQAKKERERTRRSTLPPGAPSIYKLPLPLPERETGAASEPITVRRDERSGLPAPAASATPALGRPANTLTPGPSPSGRGEKEIAPSAPTLSTAGSPSPGAAVPRPSVSPTPGASPLPRPSVSATPGGSSLPRPSGASPFGSPPTTKPPTPPDEDEADDEEKAAAPAQPRGTLPVRPFGSPAPVKPPAAPDEDETEDEIEDAGNAAPAQPRGTLRPAWMNKPSTPAPAPKPSAAPSPVEEPDEEAMPASPAPKPALSGRSLTDFMGAGIYDEKEGDRDDDAGDDDVTYEPAEDAP